MRRRCLSQMTSDIGRALVAMGLAIARFGIVLLLAGQIPSLGRLPGDIRIEPGPVHVYFPIVTMLELSLALTLALNLFSWHR